MKRKSTLALNTLVCGVLLGLAACGGGGSGSNAPSSNGATPTPLTPTTPSPPPTTTAPPAASGDLTRVSGKTPVNFRAEVLAGLVGTYSSTECIDLVTSTAKPGVIDVSSAGIVTINGATSGNLFDPEVVVSVQRGVTGVDGVNQSFLWGRGVNSSAALIFFQVTGPTIQKDVTGITVQAWINAERFGCFVPGNLNIVSKPAFFAAQKYLEVEVKDWFCIDGVNKAPVLTMGGYKNKAGEAVLGGETFSASSNYMLERLAIEPPNSPDKVVPNRGQGLVYTLETKAGRMLAAEHNDAGELLGVIAQRASNPSLASQPLDPFVCRKTPI